MKSSRASTDHTHAISKPFDHHSNTNTNTINNNNHNNNTTTSTTFPPHIFYEPTSVLDPHLPPPSDDWDPVSWLLADATDPPSPSSFDPFDLDLPLDLLDTYPHSSTNNNNNNIYPPAPIFPSFDRSHLDLLLRAAGCVEANDPAAAHMILARLNYAFPPSTASTAPLPALHRAALHFRDALLSLLPIPNPPSASPPPSPLETVHRITAQKSFSDLSPIPQFTSFTANQTLLESLLLLDHININNNNNSSSSSSPPTSIHVIDFDLGLGGQWSSFAQEIHARSRSLRASPPAVRITAVVPEETVETALAAENLRDFARAVGVRLSLDFVRVGALGALALAGVRLSAAEPVGVVLSPTVFRLLGGSPESSAALLRFVRRVSPRVVVFVDTECFAAGGASFRRSFAGGLEFYSAVLESVDAAAAATGAGEEPVRRVERSVLRPRIFSSVSMWAPREASDWRETFAAGGMAPVAFSEFTESQAEWLLRRAPAEGFHVARREGSMMLSWKGRELASTSAWRCL